MSVYVHSHGTEDGPGLACNELLLTNGQKIGACQIRTHLTNAWDEGYAVGATEIWLSNTKNPYLED